MSRVKIGGSRTPAQRSCHLYYVHGHDKGVPDAPVIAARRMPGGTLVAGSVLSLPAKLISACGIHDPIRRCHEGCWIDLSAQFRRIG